MSVTVPVAPMPPAALNELKAWLRIETNAEDALLLGQLRAAFDMARQFTGRQLIRADIAEELPVSAQWTRLSVQPVSAIVSASAILDAGELLLAPDDWQADIDRDARGWVRVTNSGGASHVRFVYRAGMAASWQTLPEALRQGVLRYAAHGYSARENADAAPPAAVTALWQPWRAVRL